MDTIKAEFKGWNPMEEDFTNIGLNRYLTGPGANICQVDLDGEKTNPFLVFKDLPSEMLEFGLFNLCSHHAKVSKIMSGPKCRFYFVYFETIADMESTYRALEHNSYGFTVLIGRRRTNSNQSNFVDSASNMTGIPSEPSQPNAIDYENRTYMISTNLLPRPKLQRDLLVDNDYCCGLLSNGDSHDLERENCYVYRPKDKFKYHTGRSYIGFPDHVKEFFLKKHEESFGDADCSSGAASYSHYNTEIYKLFNKIGNCSQCTRKCDTICSESSGYYCSIKCKEHKSRVIRAEEKNRSNQLSSSKQPVTDIKNDYKLLIPKSGSIAKIITISKPNLVFIRSKAHGDNNNYFKIMDELQVIGKQLKPLTKVPKRGNVVVAKYDNQFHRVLILNSKSKKILVHFIDYGNMDYMQLANLYETPAECVHQPIHALPVVLKGVKDCYMTEEVRNFMYAYLKDINVNVMYKDEDYYQEKRIIQVELKDEQTQQNLNKLIAKLSTPTEPDCADVICYKEYLKQQDLPIGENIELVVMDNSTLKTGFISVTIKPYALEIQKFQKDIENYIESLQTLCYTPRINELCIAKYETDGLWYRGVCLESVGDGYPTILFIDYGNICIIHINNIRLYPTQFTFPIYTADCEIEGLPKLHNDQIIAKLEAIVPHGSIIKGKLIKQSNDIYKVVLAGLLENFMELDTI